MNSKSACDSVQVQTVPGSSHHNAVVMLLLLLSMLYWSMRLCDCCVKHSQKTPSVWSCIEILHWSTHPKVNTCWTKYSWLSPKYTLFWFSSSDGSQKGRVGCYWHLCWPCLMSAREAGTLVREEQTPLACNCLPTPPKETPPADVIFMDQLFSSPEDAAIVPAAKGATLANCVCGNDNSPQSLSWVQSKTGFNHNFG